ncbi:MAG: hypothetical protein RI957_223 [Verrucomicrobiota bacterium]|jgi:SAM-dependent methyltransferase
MSLESAEFYPAMSHPPAHPSVIAATALLGGIRLNSEQSWNILEVGCASGHHILPIAEHYRQARITAIDLDARAIHEARRLAQRANLKNIDLHCADLSTWEAPAEHYDIIIAHGVFSWVPDPTKTALLELCARSLKPDGVAMISYNTQPGWAMRQPLREMTMALQHLPAHQGSACSALHWIERSLDERQDAYGLHLLETAKDARAKGETQLAFDDIASINDAFYFSQFYHMCRQNRLMHLGESDSTLPRLSLLDTTAREQLQSLAGNPLLMEQMTDFLTGRSFRCSVICRDNAVRTPATADELSTLCIEQILAIPETGNGTTDAFSEAITRAAPSCVPIRELLASLPHISPQQALSMTATLHSLGMIRLRDKPIMLSDEIPSHPRLSQLNLDHLEQGKAVVDAFHRPCLLSTNDRNWLRLCDGTMSFEQLIQSCRNDAQVSALHALLVHMNERGSWV